MAIYDLTRPENDQRVMMRDLRAQGRNMRLASLHTEDIVTRLILEFAAGLF